MFGFLTGLTNCFAGTSYQIVPVHPVFAAVIISELVQANALCLCAICADSGVSNAFYSPLSARAAHLRKAFAPTPPFPRLVCAARSRPDQPSPSPPSRSGSTNGAGPVSAEQMRDVGPYNMLLGEMPACPYHGRRVSPPSREDSSPEVPTHPTTITGRPTVTYHPPTPWDLGPFPPSLRTEARPAMRALGSKETFESANDIFTKAFTQGFAWEVPARFSFSIEPVFVRTVIGA